ncbi:unnamed protein product [Tetraodon nigroviridis]|uniref:(spotted green pufferfish) hypothetical protein n=1 Tax=Tetraodon nigroviridis TaxID=99883 RepID=Q4SNJ2_TETNG|nr:unnamed protein product [Tetraodon nigroviridis]
MLRNLSGWNLCSSCSVNGGIQQQLEKEVLHYDYHASFFDIFLLAVFRFASLILAYAVCKLRHWWAIAVSLHTSAFAAGAGSNAPDRNPLLQITTALCCAFLIIKVILSKLLTQAPLVTCCPSSPSCWPGLRRGCSTSRFFLRRTRMRADVCPSWNRRRELLSCAPVRCLTDSSTLLRSLWQVGGAVAAVTALPGLES